MVLEYPLLEPLLVSVKGQVPVLGRLLDKWIAGLGIVGIDEFLGRKRGSAFLALVAIGFGSMATRTLASNVAVSQEMASLLVVELLGGHRDELALVIELAEEVAGKLVVGLAGSAAIDVEGDAEALEAVLDEVVIAVDDFLNSDALFASSNSNGNAVFITAADEDALATFQTKIAGIDVSRHVNASQMADMYRSVRIRQSGRNRSSLEMLFHDCKLLFLMTLGYLRAQ